MNTEQLHHLLSQGESQTLEFKRSTGELKSAMKTLCAFLNGQGGSVLFGIRPEGIAVGQNITDKTLIDVAQALNKMEPSIQITSHRIKLKNGLEVLLLAVPAFSNEIPFTFDGRAYERSESTTRLMGRELFTQLLLNRSHAKRRWENQPAEGYTLENIDVQMVHRLIGMGQSAGRFFEPVGEAIDAVLARLQVFSQGELLQAAVVLFGKSFLPNYPQCELRLARFRGTDKQEFLDQRQIRGTALVLLEEALLFCDKHFPLPGRIVSGQIQRQEKPLIPTEALREILINALIHRDYSITGGAVSLAIFDDRVEIWSAGKLPLDLTPASLVEPHDSFPRNPIIADAFYRAGLIEKWGRGINRVMEQCRQHGIEVPHFEQRGLSFCVTFNVEVKSKSLSSGNLEPINELINELINEPINPKTRQRLLQEITLFKQQRSFSMVEIQQTIGISRATARRDLALFKQAGWVEFRGARKSGKYYWVKQSDG